MTGSLSRRYARALLGLARDGGTIAQAGEELARAASTFADPALHGVVLNPGIAATARRAIVGRVLERLALSPMVANLVRLLADRDRLAVLPNVERSYEALVDRELGRARVAIRSAAPLTDAQRAEIEALARRLTGSRDVIVTVTVDPALIGGVVARIGSTVYDGSVTRQLERMKQKLVEGV